MNVFKTEALASATKLLSNQDDIQTQLSADEGNAETQFPYASMLDVGKRVPMSKLLRERYSRFSADYAFLQTRNPCRPVLSQDGII
jgi:hypothetical protein